MKSKQLLYVASNQLKIPERVDRLKNPSLISYDYVSDNLFHLRIMLSEKHAIYANAMKTMKSEPYHLLVHSSK